MTIISWFIKKEITSFGSRLDKHESIILELVKDVQRLIGLSGNWTHREERRTKSRNGFSHQRQQ